MTANLKRAFAVGLTATLAFIGLLTVPTSTAHAATPASCAGVWVVVQSDEAKPSSAKIGCATTYTTGLDALQSAGFVGTGGAFLTQIDGLPTNTDYYTNGNLYWSYWSAPVNPDGTLGTWKSASGGAGDSSPSTASAEGWLLTNGSGSPATTQVFTPASSSAPASTSAPASSSAPASRAPATSATSASSSAAATAAATSLAIRDPEVVKAAGFLSKNLPTPDDGDGRYVSVALALSTARSCDYSSTIASLIISIKAQAADYVGNDPARAASLAIAAVAFGEDPTSFGGLNLLSILAAGTHPDGQVGANVSSYAQALAVIAYVRAGQPVPATVLANLVAGQDTSGAFGYSYGTPLTFYSDYDTTGLAIEALTAAHGNSAAIAKAIAWALAEQTPTGYWPNPYSPVDSTGILGSALEYAGTSSGLAATWLKAQQLPDGGFPPSVDSTTSDVMATANALWLLAGSNLVTVSTLQCPASTQGPAATGSADPSTLADTGSPVDGPIGAFAVSMLVIGAGVLVARRRQGQA